jgi:hypothetical protein
VVMLELLTGRKPLDKYVWRRLYNSVFSCSELRISIYVIASLRLVKYSERSRSEQSLVRWAIPQLHDIDALAKMVDPALKGMYPAKSLSRFADIIALCVQVYECCIKPREKFPCLALCRYYYASYTISSVLIT